MALVWMLLVAAGLLGQEPNPCAACHDEPVADFKTHKHAASGMQCGICHGPSEKHLKSVGNIPPDRVAAPSEVAALCGNCHPGQRKQYDASAHGRVYTTGKSVKTANCVTCHGQHAMRPWAAQEANCVRCHATQPAACKGKPVAPGARVACMGCHASHSMTVAGR